MPAVPHPLRLVDREPSGAAALRELGAGPGLSHPELRHDTDRLPAGGQRVLERRLEALELGRAPDERGIPPRLGHVKPRLRGPEPVERVHLERPRATLHLAGAERLEREEPLHEPARVLGQVDGARSASRSMCCARPTEWPCAM